MWSHLYKLWLFGCTKKAESYCFIWNVLLIYIFIWYFIYIYIFNVCNIMLHQDILQINHRGFPITKHHIDGLVQERRNSSALAMELRLSCINPLTWVLWHLKSPAISLLVQLLVQANIKGNTKGPHYWPIVRGIHWSLVDSPHNGPVMWKAFPCHDGIMPYSLSSIYQKYIISAFSNFRTIVIDDKGWHILTFKVPWDPFRTNRFWACNWTLGKMSFALI